MALQMFMIVGRGGEGKGRERGREGEVTPSCGLGRFWNEDNTVVEVHRHVHVSLRFIYMYNYQKQNGLVTCQDYKATYTLG